MLDDFLIRAALAAIGTALSAGLLVARYGKSFRVFFARSPGTPA